MNLPEHVFEPNPLGRYGWVVPVNFSNGYGISVVPEADGKSWQVAILCNGKLCYDSGLTEDVFRYLTEDSVRDVAAVTASLPSPN